MNKKVIVTGGTRGIGRAISLLFAENGYYVVATYKSDCEAASALERQNENIKAVRCDVSEISDIKALADAHGDAEVLVNNAGISLVMPFDAVTPEQSRTLYDTDLFGTVEMSRLILPHMLHRKSGCIINVSSVWGRDGASCEVDYSVAKAGVIGLTKALSKEVGPSGVRVNCICPGIVDTDMNSHLTYDEVIEFTDGVPLERMAKPDEVARVALFLASEAASYITGAVIDVTGGM